MNTSGRRVSESLEKIDMWARPLMEETDTPLDNLTDFAYAGRQFESQLAEIVHGDRHPGDFDRSSMRRWLRIAWKTEPAALVGAVGVAMRAAENPDDDGELPEDPEEAVAVLLDSMAKLSVQDFSADTERVLQMGALHLANATDETDNDDVTPVSMARLGYLLRAIEVGHLDDRAFDFASDANYTMVVALETALEGEDDMEVAVASVCLKLATAERGSPLAVADSSPGLAAICATA